MERTLEKVPTLTSLDRKLLQAAEKHKNFREIQALLTRGANINTQNERGYTPLHCAATEGHFLVVEFLIKQGANVSLTNEEDKTAHDVAHKNVKNILLAAMQPDVEEKDVVVIDLQSDSDSNYRPTSSRQKRPKARSWPKRAQGEPFETEKSKRRQSENKPVMARGYAQQEQADGPQVRL